MEPIPSILPVLPIRNTVVFPGISLPLVVGRPRSLRAIDQALGSSGQLVVVTQRITTPSDPEPADLYDVGTLCKIDRTVATEAGSRQIIVTGVARYRVAKFSEARATDPVTSPITSEESLLWARGEVVADSHCPNPIRGQALLNSLKSLAREILELLPGGTEPIIRLMDQVDDAPYLTHVCAAYLNISLFHKQQILETTEVERRMESLLTQMRKEREVLSVQREIREKMAERLNKAQRDALLREQLRTIRAELGEESPDGGASRIEEKLRFADLPPEVRSQVDEELGRLKALPSASAEYHVARTYLDWMGSLPWDKTAQDVIDLDAARKILDEDHFGLEQVKRRILQFLAVAKLKCDVQGPILCFAGPPGVGKTSLGQSIARTLGRPFIRTSLGGVRDEAEIRGHRRTYVGAMPGRIIQSIRRAGARNPVMVLDEIDKLRADFHGDPSAAMLEVLDPEQNRKFTDHYLDVPFDLSSVFFIATANVPDEIPAPLRDRMEVIEIRGYTPQEKERIARDHLITKELRSHGLTHSQVEVTDETLRQMIQIYTREAGVRELSRKIAAVFRSAAEQVVRGLGSRPIRTFPEQLETVLGPARFPPNRRDPRPEPGVVTGLAWTPQGGELLQIEVSRMMGQGNLMLTGNLGEVMKESAQIALSLGRSIGDAPLWGPEFQSQDVHIHVPCGGIPKDGPSAGAAIFVALVSLLLGRSVGHEIAMTGEITLRGHILAVGGVREKVMAAHRAKIREVFLPVENLRDLFEVPDEVTREIRVTGVRHVDDLIEALFGLRLDFRQWPSWSPAVLPAITADARADGVSEGPATAA